MRSEILNHFTVFILQTTMYGVCSDLHHIFFYWITSASQILLYSLRYSQGFSILAYSAHVTLINIAYSMPCGTLVKILWPMVQLKRVLIARRRRYDNFNIRWKLQSTNSSWLFDMTVRCWLRYTHEYVGNVHFHGHFWIYRLQNANILTGKEIRLQWVRYHLRIRLQ